jgi:hypothetical protein
MSNIIDLNKFRRKKEVIKEIVEPARKPIPSPSVMENRSEEDFAARLVRIRESLERISKLMVELKQEANKGGLK